MKDYCSKSLRCNWENLGIKLPYANKILFLDEKVIVQALTFKKMSHLLYLLNTIDFVSMRGPKLKKFEWQNFDPIHSPKRDVVIFCQ